jgi:glycosyltransferase Alg8
MLAASGVGVIALWRWAWGGVHFLRMLVYTRRVYPRLRAAAAGTPLPPSLGIVVTSYRMAAETNAAVYGRLLDEVAAMRVPAAVIACITDPADARLLQAIFAARPDLPEGTVLHALPQAGTGKRGAMVDALELIASLRPPPNAQLVLMDGDTLLAPGALAASCRLLASQPDIGAVTTDNIPLVRGNALAREWYRLRMAQRHALMCSMSLSRRLLVLTGRCSVFRAPLACAPGFIRALERDSIEHWRLGRIGMVTGDDKSTWFSMLRQGWGMLYLPDTVVYCIEELPGEGFLGSSVVLMRRWYGNMARNAQRAWKLGRRRLGTFTWLCLLDQRISPWTALSGPLLALHAAVTQEPGFLALYGLWVLFTRGVLTLLEWAASGRVHPLFPLLIYYNQAVGALIKIQAWHYPDRQRWTRQKLAAGVAGRNPASAFSPWFLALEAGAFLLLLAVLHGALDPPPDRRPTGLAALRQAVPPPGEPQRAPCGTPRGRPCATLTAPPPPTARTQRTPPPGP